MCGFWLAQNSKGSIDPEEWSHNTPEPAVKHEFQQVDFAEIDELPQRIAAKEERGDFDPANSEVLRVFDAWQNYYSQTLKALDAWWQEDAQKEPDFLSSFAFLKHYNARAVLLQYRNFVGPKLQRALGGRFDAGGVIPIQSDWNGSAKVVYLALEHLRIVVSDLAPMPTLKAIVKPWLLCTEDLMAQLLNDFPDLMDFERPGFDSLGQQRIG